MVTNMDMLKTKILDWIEDEKDREESLDEGYEFSLLDCRARQRAFNQVLRQIGYYENLDKEGEE